MPLHGDVGLGQAQRLAAGQLQLQLDQVDPGDCLGHRVLHLEPGVHLEEENVVSYGQELNCAKAPIRNMGADPHRRLTGSRPGERRVDGCRGLLDDLLVAALHGTIAVEKVQHRSGPVPDDLDLQVAATGQVPLDQQRAITKGGQRLPARAGQGRQQFFGLGHDPHALAATASDRLYQGWEPDVVGHPGRHQGDVASFYRRQHRDARLEGDLPGPVLAAHQLDHVRLRADEDQSGGLAGPGKRRALGQEPVARVDGVGALLLGGAQDGVYGQV